MIKIGFLYIFFFIFFIGCDDNESDPTCEELGYEVDFCGICDGTCEADNPNSCDEFDLCSDCFGDNSSCTGCMINNYDTVALFNTYNSNAIIPCEDTFECCFIGNPAAESVLHIDLKFLTDNFNCIPLEDETANCSQYMTEPSCNLFNCEWNTHFETYIGMPVYFYNTSNSPISIISTNTEPHACNPTGATVTNGISCNIDNEHICIERGCNWTESSTYNQAWDEFTIEVPPNTSSDNNTYDYINGFYTITDVDEEFCLEIETTCGTLKILAPE